MAAQVPDDFNWVRDITMNNSTWGNGLLALRAPRRGVYSLGGGIGMGLAQSIGAAVATPERKTIALFAQPLGIPHRRVTSAEAFAPTLAEVLEIKGVSIMETDMASVGPFAVPFHGPKPKA